MEINTKLANYEIDENELFKKGYLELSFLSELIDREDLIREILNNIGESTFLELTVEKFNFLYQLGYTSVIADNLFRIAKNRLNYNGSINNQYHVARYVRRGNSKEQYRGHFDSHLFTMVTPLLIPKVVDKNKPIGELYVWPNARKQPKNEIINILGKIYFKKYANKESVLKLKSKEILKTFYFEDFKPILFLGNTAFHTNSQVKNDASSDRLTFLSHYFDPNPNFSIGSILRRIRKR